jgi:hypothetical protein
MYQGAQSVRATSGSATLAQVVKPFFDRTWQHFCSHMHAPSTGEACGDAVVQRGDVIYCAHPLLSIYRDHAPRWVKEIVRACLTRLTGGLTLSHNGPSNLIAAVHGRASDANRVIHLLHYVPERRGTTLDVIEERQTVCDLGLRLRCPTLIRAARAVPRGEPLAVEPVDEGTWRIRVPRLDGRMLILVETDS